MRITTKQRTCVKRTQLILIIEIGDRVRGDSGGGRGERARERERAI